MWRNGALHTLVASTLAVACVSARSSECENGKFCPPYTQCGLNNTCVVAPGECSHFPDGLPCIGPDRAVCRNAECVTETRCGDGIVDPGEMCDNGKDNSDLVSDAKCRSTCQPRYCGDGIHDPSEEKEYCLGAATPWPVGDSPFSVVTGDLNGDGRMDLVATNLNSDDLSVLIAAPTGGFLPQARLPTGNGASGVVLGLLDGDAFLDVVVSNLQDDSVSVFLGLGDGSFGTEGRVSVGDGPRGIALGDLDENQTLDVVTANSMGNDLSILLGVGDGTFAPEEPTSRSSVGRTPGTVVLGDLDGQGHLDAVVANSVGHDLAILLGKGDGTFRPAAFDPHEVNLPNTIVLRDFTGDGKLDAAVSEIGGSSVSLFSNAGNGTFADRQRVDVGFMNPGALASGDLDGDGIFDLVTGTITGALVVLVGDGGGKFEAIANYPTGVGVTALALADMDGDGQLDVMATSPSVDAIHLHFGGDGALGIRQRFPTGRDPLSITTGDLNGDRLVDLVVANDASGELSVLMGDQKRRFADTRALLEGESVREALVAHLDQDPHPDVVVSNRNAAGDELLLLQGSASGELTLRKRLSTEVGQNVVAVVAFDMDNDGVLDLVSARLPSPSIRVRKGVKGAPFGTFGDEIVALSLAKIIVHIAVVPDLNDDTMADLLVTTVDQFGFVYTGMKDGTFAPKPLASLSSVGTFVATGDLNGDGRPDAVITSSTKKEATVVTSTGTTMVIARRIGTSGTPTATALADVNGDGHLDFLVAQNPGGLAVYLGLGAGEFTQAQTFHGGPSPSGLGTVDLTGDGLADVLVLDASEDSVSMYVGRRARMR
jgi:hypothetical protein